MASRTLSVVITGTAKDAVQAFRQTDDAAAKSQSKMAAVGQKLAGVGRVAAVGLAAGVATFGAIAVKGALEGERAAARLANAMKNAGPGFKDLRKVADGASDSFARFGFENDEVDVGLAKLAPVSKNSADALKKLGLAADIARARNISLEAATALVTKVSNGNVGALSRMGIATKNSAGETIGAEEALSKLTDLYGGSANKQAKTFAGQIEALKTQFANFAEEVGNKVLPVVKSIVKWMSENTTAVMILAGVIGGVLLIAIGAYIVSMIAAAAATIAATWPIILIIAAVAALVAAVIFLWTNWDQVWNWIKSHPAIAAAIALFFPFIAAIVATVGAVKFLYENWNTIWNAIKAVTSVAVQSILGVFQFFGTAVNTIFSTVARAISEPFRVAFAAIRTMWNSTVGGFGFKVPDWVPFAGGKSFKIPTMHAGGVFQSGEGEGLALLKDGEGVFTRDQMSAMGSGMPSAPSGGSQTNVWLTVNGSVKTERDLVQAVRSGLVQALKTGNGTIPGIAG